MVWENIVILCLLWYSNNNNKKNYKNTHSMLTKSVKLKDSESDIKKHKVCVT